MKQDALHPLSIVILAAGKGKRMHSSIPKVLHLLGGKPLLRHVIDTALTLQPSQPPLVVIGFQGHKIKTILSDAPVTWIEQKEQLGTGSAAQQTLPHIPDHNRVLILCGDVPLISSDTLIALINNTPLHDIGMITSIFSDPSGFGRILRDDHQHITGIIEEKDASPTQRAIQEINAGIYLIPADFLKKELPRLTKHNAQKEFYLTDIIQVATKEKMAVRGQQPFYPIEIAGVNDRAQLSSLERFYQYKIAEKLMQQGVAFYDPHRFDMRGELIAGSDVTIDINVIIEGCVTIGNHCKIGANSILRNVTLGDHVIIEPFSIIDGATIAEYVTIGPFARIRPGTDIASHAQIGNFSEIKNSRVGAYTKIHHVGYIGDSEIGEKTNIGAGTITCNYAGANNHQTTIGNDVFVGAHSTLVAPLTIGDHATIGAASCLAHDAPADQLTLSRAEQKTIKNWKRKKKQA